MSEKGLFARRMREAREKTGLSQKQVGIEAGLDEFVASTRINRYEQGVHTPTDIATVELLAEVLKVPAAYFFTRDDRLAEMMLLFDALTQDEQEEVLAELRSRKGGTASE